MTIVAIVSISKWITEKVKMIAEAISVDSYENMSRKGLKKIFTNPSPSILTSTSIDTDYQPKMINSPVDGRYFKYNRDKGSKNINIEHL